MHLGETPTYQMKEHCNARRENITMQEMIDKFVIEKGRVLHDMIAEIVRMTNLESERLR